MDIKDWKTKYWLSDEAKEAGFKFPEEEKEEDKDPEQLELPLETEDEEC